MNKADYIGKRFSWKDLISNLPDKYIIYKDVVFTGDGPDDYTATVVDILSESDNWQESLDSRILNNEIVGGNWTTTEGFIGVW